MKRDALAARYGAGPQPAAGPWNETLDRLLEHRSVRAYRPDPVPDGTVETLVAAAQSAATSSNMQTWSVIAVRDTARKQALARLAANQKHIVQCPLFLVFVADLSRQDRMQASERVTLETLPYLEQFLVAAIDAALAAQNAVVAAESLGLSTVYIGALRNDPIQLARELALPPKAFGVFGLCVGYADPQVRAEIKPRLPQPAIAFEEQYRLHDEVGLRRAYDERLAAFASRNEGVADTWTRRVISRMGKVSAMGGRDRLVEQLRALGFPLK